MNLNISYYITVSKFHNEIGFKHFFKEMYFLYSHFQVTFWIIQIARHKNQM